MTKRIIFLLSFFCTALSAQGRATLSGRVFDPSGQPVPQARVHLSPESGGPAVERTTDDHGLYVLVAIDPGQYQLSIVKAGFQTARRSGLTIGVAGAAVVDVTLVLGESSYSVNVEAGTTEIDRDLTATGTVVDRKFVENLPLNGRSFQSLIELSPGVVLTKSTTTSPGQFSVNGQRANANSFIVDGISANVAASTIATFSQQAAGTLPGLTVFGGTNSLVQLDALQEFRVQTSGFAAEYGRAPGAQIVMATRSGTNQMRGSLFYELRNEKLDANDWFANAAGRGRAPFRLNQFGGTLGGPVTVPGGYKGKDRTFFFVAYEGLRLREPQFSRTQVPTESARARAKGPIQQLLNAFPLPNAASPFTNPDQGLYEASFSNPATSNLFSSRIDHVMRRSGSVFFRLNIAPTDRQTRAFANQVTTTASRTDTFTGGWTLSLTPRLVSEFRANWSGSRGGFDWDCGAIAGGVCPPDELLFPAYTSRDRASAGYFLGAFLTGINPPNLTQGRSIGNRQRQLNIVEAVSWLKGGHSFRFGADFRYLFPIADFREYGISYSFGTITRAIDQAVATVSVQALAPRGGFTLPGTALYAQDVWRANPRLTVNMGLRWELVSSPRTSQDRPLYTLTQVSNLLTTAIAPAGTAPWHTRWANFEPRFGVSYLISRSRQLLFKAGVGLFHDLGTGQASRGFNSWPYNSVRSTVDAPFPAPAPVLQSLPFSTAAPYSSEFYITDPHLRQPYTMHWSAGFEKQWSRAGSLEARYVGNAGRSLLFTEFLRNRPPNPSLGLPANIVLNPALFDNNARLYLTRNLASSDYHSLQAQFRRRILNGFQAQVSYTWAKALDNLSDETLLSAPVEQINRDLNRGPADFDVRHNLVSALSYNLPNRSAGMGWLLGGWSTDSFLRLRTATPVNVLSGSDTINAGITSVVRPDLVSGRPLYLESGAYPGGRRINPNAFAAPGAGRQGHLGRNALRGFSAIQWDLALRREFLLAERVRTELRAEAYNVLNRPNFADPSGVLASGSTPDPAFGLSQNMLGRSLSGSGGFSPLFQVGGPRSMQFVLKVMF
ncbi:MAG: TonB-dependent receptor [Bryobacterales bacterium]|nr:TonB-dependent receptor [Bryobacterales bacterium]